MTLTLWDMAVSATQRAAAAWALGQIGGLQPARKLLNRLEALFVQRGAQVLGPTDRSIQTETNEVNATLIEALARALDEATVRVLNPYDRQQLRQVSNALLDQVRTPEEIDPDLSTALALSLARLALNARQDMPQHTLRDLLNIPEPIATLAAIGVLTRMIPAEQRDEVLENFYNGQPEVRLEAVFDELGRSREQPYSPAERRHLVQLAGQFWYAEYDTQLTGDHLWEKIQHAWPGVNLTQA
ncbi:MAG: hypothetical protein KDI79_20650 [Anaerolineae bacterium]|nr:hypothetical protein [Anaerolineae bacterium]